MPLTRIKHFCRELERCIDEHDARAHERAASRAHAQALASAAALSAAGAARPSVGLPGTHAATAGAGAAGAAPSVPAAKPSDAQPPASVALAAAGSDSRPQDNTLQSAADSSGPTLEVSQVAASSQRQRSGKRKAREAPAARVPQKTARELAWLGVFDTEAPAALARICTIIQVRARVHAECVEGVSHALNTWWGSLHTGASQHLGEVAQAMRHDACIASCLHCCIAALLPPALHLLP